MVSPAGAFAFLACPAYFVVHRVRTKREAEALLRTALVAQQLDYVIAALRTTHARAAAVRPCVREASASSPPPDPSRPGRNQESLDGDTDGREERAENDGHARAPLIRALIPSLRHCDELIEAAGGALRARVGSCHEQLVALRGQLEHFAEQNASVAHEFIAAGCDRQARSKLAVAWVERVLVERLGWILSGDMVGSWCPHEGSMRTVCDRAAKGDFDFPSEPEGAPSSAEEASGL